MRSSLVALALGVAALVAPTAPHGALAEGKTHYLAIHVDDNDPAKMNMALNNAENVRDYYEKIGDKVMIEIVAYGPGLHMLREDTSPVKTRIAAMSLADENLSFAACGNTQRKMSEQAGKDIPLIAEARVVPAGVVRLMELQEQGWTYIRP